jgi:hypothetical protein
MYSETPQCDVSTGKQDVIFRNSFRSHRICNPEPFVDDADCKSAHVITLDCKSSVTVKIGHALRGELGRASKTGASKPCPYRLFL